MHSYVYSSPQVATYRPIAPADASLRAFTAHASYVGVSVAQPPGYRGSLASVIIATHRAAQHAPEAAARAVHQSPGRVSVTRYHRLPLEGMIKPHR